MNQTVKAMTIAAGLAVLFSVQPGDAAPKVNKPSIPAQFHGRWADDPATCNQIMTVLTYKKDGIYLDEGSAVLLKATYSSKKPNTAIFKFKVYAGGESAPSTEQTTLVSGGKAMQIRVIDDPKMPLRILKRCPA
jgi:hypothetical protein